MTASESGRLTSASVDRIHAILSIREPELIGTMKNQVFSFQEIDPRSNSTIRPRTRNDFQVDSKLLNTKKKEVDKDDLHFLKDNMLLASPPRGPCKGTYTRITCK